MNRRDNLKALGLLTSHALFPGVLSSFLNSCTSKESIAEYKPDYFSKEEMTILAELVDLIIPPTDTPGASDVGVHVFIDQYVMNCFLPEQHKDFKAGLAEWQKNGALDREEKFEILTKQEQESHQNSSSEAGFIKTLKSLTLLGYFFSEKGAAASGYIAVPGVFQGCTDLKEGQYAELLNSMT